MAEGLPHTEIDEGGTDLGANEMRILWVCVGSFALSATLIVLMIFFIRTKGTLRPAILTAFPSLTLWSLVVTGFAFHSLYRIFQKAKAALERRSFLDPVTGVFNYRYLDQRLGEEFERTRRYGGFTAVLYMDLDHFKTVNDRLGHQVGNVVLQEIASVLADGMRTCDVLGRVGGDEFLAVLPETDRRQAEILAGRLQEAVESYCLDLGEKGQVDFVRLSVGVAAYPVNGDSMENVVNAADNAVYEAKKQGGNTVCVASGFVSTDVVEDTIIRKVRDQGAESRKVEVPEENSSPQEQQDTT